LWTKTHWVPQRVTEVRSRSTEPLPQSWAETLKYNPLRQMSRGKSEKNPGFAMVVLPPPWQIFYGCLFVYESDFDFITLPAHQTTGSSIMPHKTGCFELIRGKCNKIQALPYEIFNNQ
jgi:argininosuccinate lyase